MRKQGTTTDHRQTNAEIFVTVETLTARVAELEKTKNDRTQLDDFTRKVGERIEEIERAVADFLNTPDPQPGDGDAPVASIYERVQTIEQIIFGA